MPLKLVRFKKSKNWYIRGTVAGQSVNESTGTDRKDVAEALRIKRENELHQGIVNGSRKTAAFVEAVDAYLEGGGSARHMEKVLEQFEFTPLRGIGQRELDAAALRAYPGVKPQTLNRHFYTPFIAVMNFAAQDGLCDFRQWRRPRVKRSDTKRAKWFSEADAAKFYAAAPAHLQAIFVFCIYTGARITEAVELSQGDIDLTSRWAVLCATKTDGYRGVPLHPAAARALREHWDYRAWRRGAGLPAMAFLTPSGTAYASRRGEDGTLSGGGHFKTAWTATLRRAGLEGYTPYSMRHTFNNWLIRAGVNQVTREALMGHDGGSINAVYSDVPQADLIAAVDLLPDFTLHGFSTEKSVNS